MTVSALWKRRITSDIQVTVCFHCLEKFGYILIPSHRTNALNTLQLSQRQIFQRYAQKDHDKFGVISNKENFFKRLFSKTTLIKHNEAWILKTVPIFIPSKKQHI